MDSPKWETVSFIFLTMPVGMELSLQSTFVELNGILGGGARFQMEGIEPEQSVQGGG